MIRSLSQALCTQPRTSPVILLNADTDITLTSRRVKHLVGYTDAQIHSWRRAANKAGDHSGFESPMPVDLHSATITDDTCQWVRPWNWKAQLPKGSEGVRRHQGR